MHLATLKAGKAGEKGSYGRWPSYEEFLAQANGKLTKKGISLVAEDHTEAMIKEIEEMERIHRPIHDDSDPFTKEERYNLDNAMDERYK